MISIGEAADIMLPRFAPLGAERVPLEHALGRFLVAPLTAREDVPGFDNSAMDGYALVASEVAGATREAPVLLPVEGESRAGGPPPAALRRGAAMRIFTGAPLPAGADAVVMQEDTELRGEQVAVFLGPDPGRHVRERAEDIRSGQTLLLAGAHLGAGEIGLLASQGHAQVPVHRRPRVALLSTGDELREIGAPKRPGSLIDSNTYALAAAVREAGGEPVALPLGADRVEELAALVQRAIASADVLVTCGGVSVGEYDLLHRAFEDAGVESLFWKVRVKPGKPLRFGAAGRVPVVGLPGNPVSASVVFEAFVRPGLRRMLGARDVYRPCLQVEIAEPLRAPATRTELARARLQRRPDLPPLALPHPRQGSAALTSLVRLDALVILPEGSGEAPAGSLLRALDLRCSGGVPDSPWSD